MCDFRFTAQRDNDGCMVITTPRLRLRRFQDTDRSALIPVIGSFDFATDDEALTLAERTDNYIQKWTAAGMAGVTDFVIELRLKPFNVIGKIGVWKSLPSNEVGIMLNREYWGRGYASEALESIIAYLAGVYRERNSLVLFHEDVSTFTNLSRTLVDNKIFPYRTLEAVISPKNKASLVLFQKHNFRRSDQQDVLRRWWEDD